MLGKAIVMCEYSGIVRDALTTEGWEAWSCDLLPTESPGKHIISESDLHSKDILYSGKWDLIIGHPPCTRLTNAGYWYIKQNDLWQDVYIAAQFFNMILNAPSKWGTAVENPIMSKEARKYIRKQDQIIQPYNFGEDASKSTCLWLEGLPKLKNTKHIPGRILKYKGKKVERWANQTPGGWNKLGPSETRGKDRSKTYPGIASAMAIQWSNYLKKYVI